jgi:glycine cleavage system H lipoate-binding protein
MLSGHETLTGTGERVLQTGDLVHVGSGDAIRDYTGLLVHLHVLKEVGDFIKRGEAVIVAEGDGGAVELYAPCDGTLLWINAALEDDPRWLFKLRIAPSD